jgi:hypothetical protein
MFSKLAALSLLPLIFGAPTPSDGPSKYIVVMKPGVETASITSNLDGVEVSHQYSIGNFKGFAADLTPAHLAALKSDPSVRHMENTG